MNSIEQHFAATTFAIIGHRGAAGIAPENTLPGFERALQLGCCMVELDVHVTKDEAGRQALLVIHDAKVDRTTNGHGRIADFTTEQLRALDAGDGQPIPLLREIVDLLHRHRANTGATAALNIELKGAHTAMLVASALQKIHAIPVLVSSFDHAELQHFRQLDTTTPIGVLFDRYRQEWPEIAASLTATTINISQRVATTKRVQAMRDAGYRVFVYTVNSTREALRLQDMGVSGVFTDRPDLLMARQKNSA